MDRLLGLLHYFGFNAATFFNGDFCGANVLGTSEHGQLHFVRSGELVMEHEQHPDLHITEPALILYPRPVKHRLTVVPGSVVNLVCANIQFNDLKRNPFASALPDILHIHLKDMPSLEPILKALFYEGSSEHLGNGFVLDRLCDVVMVHILRHLKKLDMLRPGPLLGLFHPNLAHAIRAMHDSPEKPWRMDDLALLTGMSRTSFINHFRDTVGMPPAEYLLNWRMGVAEKLLKEKKSIKATALAVGYSSQPAFSKAFAARYGVSPAEWQKQFLN